MTNTKLIHVKLNQFRLLGASAFILLTIGPVLAQNKPATGKPPAGQAQALLLETSGKWQAFATQGTGKSRVCYALGKPAERKPANLKDVAGYVFVSNRPAEGVRNEISFVLNFDLKEGIEHQALVGEQKFGLVAKGQNLWLKNPAEEPRVLDAMRKGTTLEIRATSKKGNATSDKYTLAGLAQTVKKAEDACK
jgi:invasion protein IalB